LGKGRADDKDIALLFTEWLESKSYHEAAKAVEGDVLGVKRVRNEVSIEVERALLGMSLSSPSSGKDLTWHPALLYMIHEEMADYRW
jgi:hypothetical protein